MTNYKKQWDRTYRPDAEKNGRASQTIPDQSMSVREMMERHVRGLPVQGIKVPMYDEYDDLPDPRRLDLVERQELSEQYQDKLDQIKKKHKAPKAFEKTPTEVPKSDEVKPG